MTQAQQKVTLPSSVFTGVTEVSGVAAADAVERGEVVQVLADGQVQVQRRLLEHDAQTRERR